MYNHDQEKVKLDLSINTLDNIVIAFFSENINITKKFYFKVRDLMNITDKDNFEADREFVARFELIDKLIDAKLNKRIMNKHDLVDYISGGINSDITDPILSEIIEEDIELSNESIQFIDDYISDRLQYSYIFKNLGPIEDIIMKIQTNEFSSLKSINNQFDIILQNIQNKMKGARVASKESHRDFTTDKESLASALNTTIQEKKRPSSIIRTGVEWLNQALAGGFQSNRIYLFLALPKGGKSTILINTALWAKKYNPNLKAKDPTKKACIVYLTQENNISETIERVWNHYFGNDKEMDLSNFTDVEALDMLDKAGFNDEDVAIKIMYRPAKSINTAELDQILDDLEADGLECVMLVQDYIKKLRSVERNTELRLELGDISNELSTIAKTRSIPVITASQLNREAAKVVESAISSNKVDIIKLLNSSHIGESSLMIENFDSVFIIGSEYKVSINTKFMSFKSIAVRYRVDDDAPTFFSQPYENGMKLVEDVDCTEVASLRTLADDMSNVDMKSLNKNSITKKPSNSSIFSQPDNKSNILDLDL